MKANTRNRIRPLAILVGVLLILSPLQADPPETTSGDLSITIAPEPWNIQISGLLPGSYDVHFSSPKVTKSTTVKVTADQKGEILFDYPTETFIHQGQKNALSDSFWVMVPAGSYYMQDFAAKGEDRDESGRIIELPQFWMSRTEVSNAQFCRFLNECSISEEEADGLLDLKDRNCRIKFENDEFVCKSGFDDHPVTEVTWHGAHSFCTWVGGRLPTVVEWEYAATGRKGQTLYGNGHNKADPKKMNYNPRTQPLDCSGSTFLRRNTQPVGSYSPNENGLYDMSGNVWEWCLDSDRKVLTPNSSGGTSMYCPTCMRIIKGGAWSTTADKCKVRYNFTHIANSGCSNLGFRVCRSL